MDHNNEIFKHVVDVIMENVDIPKSKIQMDSLVREDLGADSLDSIEIIMELEDKLGITISDNDSIDIRTVGDLVRFASEAKAKLESTSA